MDRIHDSQMNVFAWASFGNDFITKLVFEKEVVINVLMLAKAVGKAALLNGSDDTRTA
ncbi:protein of unknown function [Brevefilum fermentans]|jgi:hypothetical protein|uniref:Uncharacterized protein n=1 Tax=Candidatus Brevifilum fermentans TaxID=1986204 RepID=A0A1Y6K5K1_9CHLR|nr:protein of unknown function [Brevefilum fermentans]